MSSSRTLRRAAVLAAAVAVTAAAGAHATTGQGRGNDRSDRDDARMFYATTNQNLLIQFDERRPDRLLDAQSITGLPAGVTLTGIDFRPQTGDLYGVGSNSVVYRVNPATGIAVAENVGPDGQPVAFTPALRGAKFGVDFNPTVDKIRVTSDAGENLRLNVDEGTLLSADANLNPGTPTVVGSAYTNSSFSAMRPATTVLHALDAATDRIFVQNPPNNGTLTNGKRLGFDVGLDSGFDIAGDDNKGYIATKRAGARGSSLYRVDPTTGRSKSLGRIGNGRRTVTGLAAWQD
jgi:Domain of unknown function (DUF4394)